MLHITPVLGSHKETKGTVIGYLATNKAGEIVGKGETHLDAIISGLGFDPRKVAMAVAHVATFG